MLMREHACCVLGPLWSQATSTGLEHLHTRKQILQTAPGWSKGEIGGQHSVHASTCTNASKATPAIQGHPLAPAAWHGTMVRSMVLVLSMVQQGGGQLLARGVHRLLLEQASNPRTGPYNELNFNIDFDFRNTVKLYDGNVTSYSYTKLSTIMAQFC